MNDQATTLLLIGIKREGNQTLARLLVESMDGAARVIEAETLEEALESGWDSRVEFVLRWLGADERLEREAEALLQTHFGKAAVIGLVEDATSERLGLKALGRGVQDYLVVGRTTPEVFKRSLRYAAERKKADRAIRETEERFRAIYENTVEGIFQTTPSGQYLLANPALARIYGYETPQQLITGLTNLNSDLYIEPTRRKEFLEVMERDGVVRDFHSRVYRKDGSVIWISENCRAVRSANGTIVYYEGTVVDITARMLIEEELRTSETLYHSLVETLPQNIFRKNVHDEFTFANKRFCQTVDRSLDEIIGHTDFDLYPPKLAKQFQEDDRQIMESGQAVEKIEENQTATGEQRYVNVVKTPLYDAHGQVCGLQGIFWDVTEKKRAEEQIRQANAELEKSREELRGKNDIMEADLRMAREIQQAIIPQTYPTFPKGAKPSESSIQFCHRYLPAGEVGGDFFSIIPLSNQRAGVFICDVMGHGVRSALVTAIMRALVEELTRGAHDPGELLGQINRDLKAIFKQSRSPLHTTACYAVIDHAARKISYACAAHSLPMILRRSENKTLFAPGTSPAPMALGMASNTHYQTLSMDLMEGDSVVLFTDGIYDVEVDGDMLSLDWVLQQFASRLNTPTNDALDFLVQSAKDLSGGKFADDVCLVGVDLKSEVKKPYDFPAHL